MDWFYVNNGQQIGPVSDAELHRLAQSGTITSDTPVWRLGLAKWLPYGTVRPVVAGPCQPPVIELFRCVECRRSFDRKDLLRWQVYLVCAECRPVLFKKLHDGIKPGASQELWQSGGLLVTRNYSWLPDRCVICNAPARGFRIMCELEWHPPSAALAHLGGHLVGTIVILARTKKARVGVGRVNGTGASALATSSWPHWPSC